MARGATWRCRGDRVPSEVLYRRGVKRESLGGKIEKYPMQVLDAIHEPDLLQFAERDRRPFRRKGPERKTLRETERRPRCRSPQLPYKNPGS